MAVIDGVIRLEDDGTFSFGDYLSEEKKKIENFEAEGGLYKVKTHRDLTRLEKNGKLLIETVPGAVAHRFKMDENELSMELEGFEDTRVTVEIEPEQLYRVMIEDINIGNVKSNISGKVVFSLELDENPKPIKIIKV